MAVKAGASVYLRLSAASMRLTKHAQEKWEERFPHLDPLSEWHRAKKPGKKGRKQIREQCPNHMDYACRKFNGRYFLISRNSVCFVVAPPEVVITVFPLGLEP